MNRAATVKALGAPWNVASGDKALYLTNNTTEDVKRFTISTAENAMPVLSVSNPVFFGKYLRTGVYPFAKLRGSPVFTLETDVAPDACLKIVSQTKP